MDISQIYVGGVDPRTSYEATMQNLINIGWDKFRPQDVGTFLGNTFGEYISGGEYMGQLENIYGPGTEWDTAYPAPAEQAEETLEQTPTATPTVINPTDTELADMLKSYNQTKTNIEEAQRQGLVGVQQARDMLEESRLNLSAERDSGLAGNRAYFGAVSPDAYQSQIGTYNTKVKDAYAQGEKSLDRNLVNIEDAKTNVGNQFATDTINAKIAYDAAIKPTATGGYTYDYTGSDQVAAPEHIAAGVDPRNSSAIGAINNQIGGWISGAPMSSAVADYNSSKTPFDQWFNK